MSDTKAKEVETKADPRQHDLTEEIIPFLDPHMVLPLLDHLREHNIYPAEDITVARYQLMTQKTNMIDFAMDDLQRLVPEASLPAELANRKTEVLQTLHTLKGETKALLDSVFGENYEDTLEQKDVSDLINLVKNRCASGRISSTPQSLTQLQAYARALYDIGFYKNSLIYLYVFRCLNKEEESSFQALWGTLAAEILMASSPVGIERALRVLLELRDSIDQRIKTDHIMQLQQRSWLIHWSLWLFFKNQPSEKTYTDIVDFFTNDKIINTVQTTCPHILRYLTVAVVCQQRHKNRKLLDDLLNWIAMESVSDPVTSFLMALRHDFDMEAAHAHLLEAEALFDSDFFLSLSVSGGQRHVAREDFMQCARSLLFEVYCSTHERIDLSLLASRLRVSEEEVCAQFVRYIRDEGLNAKIDSKSNQLVMESEPSPVYQTVIKKTKSMEQRTQVLIANLEKSGNIVGSMM